MGYTLAITIVSIMFIVLGVMLLSPFLQYVFGQVKGDSISVTDTISNTDTRKSFGYCPIDSDTQTVLIKYGVTYTIEGCPLSRVYVDNWDKLDDNTKQNIVSELESKGYRMEKE